MAVIKRRSNDSLRSTLGSDAVLDAYGLIEVAKRVGIQTSPINVAELARHYGIKVDLRPMEDDISGHLSLKNGTWHISVNSLHHWKRQRFTLAHELGHFFLHRWKCQNFTDKMLFRKNETSPMEVEANNFAADLLMPEREFRDYIGEKSSKVEELAEHFAVSALAVRVRAKKLGYQGHGL